MYGQPALDAMLAEAGWWDVDARLTKSSLLLFDRARQATAGAQLLAVVALRVRQTDAGDEAGFFPLVKGRLASLGLLHHWGALPTVRPQVWKSMVTAAV